jgi:Carboxypeptidase regulatory-like domain
MRVRQLFCSVAVCISITAAAVAQQAPGNIPPGEIYGGTTVAAPAPQSASISGTVVDSNGGIVPSARVILNGPTAADQRAITANEYGGYVFADLKPGVTYHLKISANGFAGWTSPVIVLSPGQFFIETDSKLTILGGATSVTVYASQAQLAVEQVKLEEQQRVLGFIPNFYVAYDHHAAPLTAKLKFKLAWKAESDPVTVLGVGFVAGLDQAGSTPDYGGGAEGYSKRFGALYADGFTDIMFGGAILPVLLHQDPRYFYQGTGTTRSRLIHALASPFVCRGDNGKTEVNFSSMGGDLISGAISNAYYPESNRGPGLVFVNAGITTGGRMVNGVVQEFLLKRFTAGAKNRAE